jgi:hypothetical protein
MHIEGMLDALDGIDRYAPLGRERFEADELVQTFIIVQLMTLGGERPGYRLGSAPLTRRSPAIGSSSRAMISCVSTTAWTCPLCGIW